MTQLVSSSFMSSKHNLYSRSYSLKLRNQFSEKTDSVDCLPRQITILSYMCLINLFFCRYRRSLLYANLKHTASLLNFAYIRDLSHHNILLFNASALWADAFIESQCQSIYLSVCLSPFHVTFFEASHWPSGHMISSKPLIGQLSFTPKLGTWGRGGRGGIKNKCLKASWRWCFYPHW